MELGRGHICPYTYSVLINGKSAAQHLTDSYRQVIEGCCLIYVKLHSRLLGVEEML